MNLRPHFGPGGTPSYNIPFGIQGLGGAFSPVHSQGLKPRWVSYYTLFKGWLLLSLPSHCLRFGTLFLT